MKQFFKVYVDQTDVTVTYFVNDEKVGTVTTMKSDHVESQVQQIKSKMIANHDESVRLTSLLNHVPVTEEKPNRFQPPTIEPSGAIAEHPKGESKNKLFGKK